MTNPHDIIKKPVVTEQSMMEMANKKYTFVVAKDANKTEIKKAVAVSYTHLDVYKRQELD